jgi:hypothetical protein
MRALVGLLHQVHCVVPVGKMRKPIDMVYSNLSPTAGLAFLKNIAVFKPKGLRKIRG